MNRVFKSRQFIFIFISIMAIGISVASAYTLLASNTGFTPRDTTWNVDNVKDAIDDLHTRINDREFYFRINSFVSTSVSSAPSFYPTEFTKYKRLKITYTSFNSATCRIYATNNWSSFPQISDNTFYGINDYKEIYLTTNRSYCNYKITFYKD